MSDVLKAITTLNIKDIEFDEENDGIILVKTFGKTKIGIGISKREGADAEIWLNCDEVRELINSLNQAIQEVSI